MSDKEKFEDLRIRQRNYKLALNAPGVTDMLGDLAKYCRAVRGLAPETEAMDPIRMAMLVGRQQVWERMQVHFRLTTEELFLIYEGRPFHVGEDDAA